MSVRIRSASAKKPGRKKSPKTKAKEEEKKKKEYEKEQEELRKKRKEAMLATPATVANVKTKETTLDILISAAKQKKLVEFYYLDSKANKSRRRIELYNLKYDPKGFKVYGYCFLRKQIRVFFIKRMSSVLILAETYEPRYPVTILKDAEALNDKRRKL